MDYRKKSMPNIGSNYMRGFGSFLTILLSLTSVRNKTSLFKVIYEICEYDYFSFTLC